MPYHITTTVLLTKHEFVFVGSVAAQHLGIGPYVFSSITGAIYITTGRAEEGKKVNIGLNLKFNSRNEEVCYLF